MTVWVFDATPLIYLGKLRILEKLTHTTNLIPRSVYQEVVERGNGLPEAQYIQNLIGNGTLRIVEVTCTLRAPHLDAADLDVLSHAKGNNCTAIVDDRAARLTGEFANVKTAGSIHVLFTLLHQKKLRSQEVKQAIDTMIDHGWYCSTDLYSKILQKLTEHNRPPHCQNI
ncbi:DUF3368 domain-containing protein [Candidatus Woesearchaeota archaeon]|nr:DUF3368 domain-containing protein [Candidatus Woesearchaeota archaeon]